MDTVHTYEAPRALIQRVLIFLSVYRKHRGTQIQARHKVFASLTSILHHIFQRLQPTTAFLS